jgi:hypothetical protein
MSEKHANPAAWHDPALWRWSESARRWVRATETVVPGDAWGDCGWCWKRRRWDKPAVVAADGGAE